MVVRKETQQTGVKVNQPAQRNVPHGMRALSAILAMVMTMALMLLYAPVPKAEAEETQESQSGTMLSIDSSTAVLTDTSGYHLSATVTNTTDQEIPSGTLTLAMNAFYTFVSRNDIQEWSEGIGQIPTPNIVGQSEVPALQPGASANVHIDADSNQETLASVNSWGPKPVTLSYEANGVQQDEAHTFATRTGAGINTPDTPAMNITIVQPLEAQGWTTDNTMLEQLVNKGGVTSAELSKIAVPGKEDEARLKSLEQTFTKHDKLQVVADPTYLKAMPMPPQVDGITQPALFDITAYSALNDSKTYDSAGVGTSQWNAEQALKNYQSALGDPNASMTTYAWQGTGNWTADALAKAKQQGYDTVIATHDFEEDDAATAETGKTVVTTDAGDITVLTAQSVLSNLAQGKATSADAEADGEGTTAGRLARFVAQSAFYQMEQPYTSRYLLMTFSRTTEASWIDQVMSAFEQASWLNLTDLKTMAKADPYNVSDSVNPDKADDANTANTRSALRQLADSRHDIMRMATSILRNEIDSDEVSSLDPQALARQDANDTASHSNDPTQWIGSLLALHDDMALRSMSGSPQPTATRKAMVKATKTLASDLLNGVRINPSESISVFSESAKMPITVSNDLPYAVSVQVNSLTDSMQIVTSRTADIDIPSHSDAQVTFTIRVSTSGSSTAHVSLTDREGNSFGNTQDTAITSVMRISDASGFIIIGFAVLLGIIGLWRQFHRKKDPDE